MTVLDQLPMLPVVLPLLAGAVLLMVDEGSHRLKAVISLAAAIATLAVFAVIMSHR